MSPDNITVNESTDFLVFCNYDANPASIVSVKWRKNGQVVRVDRDERLEGGNPEQTALLVKNASRTDLGIYTCELANAIGNDTSDNSVDVKVLCEYPLLYIGEYIWRTLPDDRQSGIGYCRVGRAEELFMNVE